MQIAVVIPTKNEGLMIERAVVSAKQLGPVIVVDSFSEDDTAERAHRAGAEVVSHAWEGYSVQKNWAIELVHSRGFSWVFFLDADEIITDDLARCIRRLSLAETRHNGFWIPRSFWFLGRELRHCWWYPDLQLRLFRVDAGRFEDRLVHEHVVLTGTAQVVQDASIVHDDRRGLERWLQRHVTYAVLEAAQLSRTGTGERSTSLLGGWQDRRAILKRVWLRLPARPLLRFLWLYVIKRGFLDGRAGLAFCKGLAAYELMIDVMREEVRVVN